MSNDTTYQELNYLLSDYCVPGPVRGAGHVEMENAEAVPILIQLGVQWRIHTSNDNVIITQCDNGYDWEPLYQLETGLFLA